MQTVDILEAFTEKADGTRIAVEAANIVTRDGASGLAATYARDLKQRTIIFPDVGVGDTLVMTYKWERSAADFSPDSSFIPRYLHAASPSHRPK
jgi:hypothetical protein